MKTIFKVGMEVYDQVNFPNKKGKVVDTEPNGEEDDYPIEVEFEDNYCSSCYTFDGRLDLEEIPTLSTKPYEIEFKGFEQKAPVPDFYNVYDRKSHVFVASDYNENYQGYPTLELADAAEAVRKLLFLRDYYNEGWRPDYKGSESKFSIIPYEDNIVDDTTINVGRVLIFKTKEIRDRFLKEQRELLEIAKPLL
nr:MAG TPA: hypothetical protein [Caudoviricetes sp.]